MNRTRECDARRARGMPTIAPWVLGPLGAVPFVALTPQAREYAMRYRVPFVLNAERTAHAQVAYGAVILSFLGGMHWSLAGTKYGNPALSPRALGARYTWSVIPSLIAWPALLMPEQAACTTVASGLAAACAVDTKYAAQGAFPRWMLPLRYALTATGMASLMATAMRDRSKA